MPKARDRLLPTTSMITAPTTASMICVWMTTTLRAPWLRRRGRSASAVPNSAASESRSSASRISVCGSTIDAPSGSGSVGVWLAPAG